MALLLDALCRALRLDDAERTHLLDLVRTASTNAAVRRRPAKQSVRPAIQAILDSQSSRGLVGNSRRDVVASNPLGRAVLSPLYEDPTRPVNTARFRFLNPRAAGYYLDWDRTGHDTVAGLRSPLDRIRMRRPSPT